MKKIELQVKGMHCRSCEMLIKEALEEVQGVNRVDIRMDILAKTGIATIDYDDSKIKNYAVLKDVIRKQGNYEVADYGRKCC
jgi:copper chaperone